MGGLFMFAVPVLNLAWAALEDSDGSGPGLRAARPSLSTLRETTHMSPKQSNVFEWSFGTFIEVRRFVPEDYLETLARRAANILSLIRQTGSTSTQSYLSCHRNVFPYGPMKGRKHRGANVIPADGPSVGIASEWEYANRVVEVLGVISSSLAQIWRTNSRLGRLAHDLPNWPVITKLPLPFIFRASMNRTSPPTAVHASPVATPI